MLEPPGARWWNELPRDFYRRRDHFDLGPIHRTQVQLTAALDVVTRTFGASMVATALPLGFTPDRLLHLREDAEFYAAFADRADATGFFVPPSERVPIEQRSPTWPYFVPHAGRVHDLRFESPFRPRNPRLAGARGKNRFAHARYWAHNDGPRPTIVAIHGFSADLYALNEWVFALPWFYDIGCDVLLFTLPHHGKRKSAWAPFSGHGFFAGGICGINEAFAQAVHDFRIFYAWLREHGVDKVGVTGVSLGGYTSALLACLEPSLQFSIPNVPLVSLIDVALEWKPVSTLLQAVMHLGGIDLVELRRIFAVSSPLTYPPLLDRERLMIIGGIADRLVPPKHSRVLWEHWHRCRLHWFPGSHVLHLDRGRYLRRTARFLRRIGFLA